MTLLINGELVLYGEVGEGWWGDWFAASQVVEALAEHGSDNDLAVRLNSPGGLAYEGVSIFNALKSHQGKVTIYVDGLAASAASIIAMAGDEIVMREGSTMMIHDPATIAWGNSGDLTKAIQSLDKLGEQMAGIYARVSSKSKDDARTIMKEETWLTGEEAVAEGFATANDNEPAVDPVAFDYRIYAKAPEHLKLVAKHNDWTFRRPSLPQSAASAAPTRQDKEKPMSGKPQAADDQAVDTAAIAQATADAIAAFKTRCKEVKASEPYKGNEALAEHMIDNTDLAAADIIAALEKAPKIAAPEQEQETDPEGYDKGRTLATDLAQPSGGQGKKQNPWTEVVTKGNRRMKKVK
ncbi:ATP-dependent protease ClpP, protease subunit [Cohaesibacter sp. ES.047]|uniref:head maturation protease, ClpP-related n=1 Tax=Cohaesibacter sp. ES.047 TaxID=1798205 RepID=UPI000BBFB399|nr:head maturation protease, ClpP-related [Cohaesibacter sp. ES.047]SNY94069.1 ATP-dependent protease ClpP, protease subunit [Cohaesibacter sp. ES.047]